MNLLQLYMEYVDISLAGVQSIVGLLQGRAGRLQQKKNVANGNFSVGRDAWALFSSL